MSSVDYSGGKISTCCLVVMCTSSWFRIP